MLSSAAYMMKQLDVGTMVQDVQLQIAAAVFAAACKAAFGLGMQCLHASRLSRALWSMFMSCVLLTLQPLIYRSPTQPLSIVLAALCVFDAFCMLTWGFIKPLTARPGPRDIIRSSFDFMMDGVIKVHKRRLARLQASTAVTTTGLANSQATGTALAADTVKQQKAVGGPAKPIIHVTAVAEPHTTAVAAPGAATHTSSSISASLWSAMLTHISLCIVYDLGYALLCCTTHLCNPSAQFSSPFARYAFSQAAGLLLPMQMSIGYAFTRMCVLASGDAGLAAALPEHAFNSPLLATSVNDLWSNRWHQFLRYYFQNLGYGLVNVAVRPFIKLCPIPLQKFILSTASTLAVFAMSGLLHEYMIWAAFGVYSGKQMTFFMVNALFELAETNIARFYPGLGAAFPVWLKRVYAIAVMVMLGPLFTEPYRQNGYFQHCFHPLMWPVAATATWILGLGACA